MGGRTYSQSGIDNRKAKRMTDNIAAMLRLSNNDTVLGPGHFAGVIRSEGKYAALHMDNVGQKVVVALHTGIIWPTGVDVVAMNVNDILCVGAKPAAFVDYIALEKQDERIVKEVLKGVIRGAKLAGVENEDCIGVVGGETSAEPNVISGYDLSGAVLGFSDSIKTGSDIAAGDSIIGLGSSGVHANGFGLIIDLIRDGKISLDKHAKALMEPTNIYVKPVLPIFHLLSGAAHITGGSFGPKIGRVTKRGMSFRLPDPPEIFKVIEDAGVSHKEMHRVYNMGVGIVLFCPRKNEDEVLGHLAGKAKVYRLGTVTKGKQMRITTYKDERITY